MSNYDKINANSNSSHTLDNLNIISGTAKVLDGDSIIVSNKEVRLVNIDAPEYNQKCLDKNNKEYFCGKVSARFLRKMVQGKKVTCNYNKKDIYNRFLGNCFVKKDININQELVKNGMAIVYSFQKVSDTFDKIEEYAKSNSLGIWGGSFLEPYKYRKKLR